MRLFNFIRQSRCDWVRQKLLDHIHERLDTVTQHKIQEHLYDCSECYDLFWELSLQVVSTEEKTLHAAPRTLAQDWYEILYQERATPIGLSWDVLREKLRSGSDEVGEWARQQIEHIGDALQRLYPLTEQELPNLVHPVSSRDILALAFRSAPSAQRESQPVTAPLLATVVGEQAQPVPFTIQSLEDYPKILPEGRLRREGRLSLRLQTETPGYQNYVLYCSVELSGNERVAFEGIVKSVSPRTPTGKSDIWEVEINAEGIPCPMGVLPLQRFHL